MYKFNNSNLSLDEWIRLNDIEIPQIIEASEIIADQAETIEQQEDKILELTKLIESFDFESIQYELDSIDSRDSTDKNTRSITLIERVLNNYKLRIKDV